MITCGTASGERRVAHGAFKARGVTLIELIVVIAIIAILIAVIMPAISNARQAAYKTAALSQEHQLGLAAMLYTNDFDTRMVPSTNYGIPETEPERIWSVNLFGYAGNNKGPFIAKGSNGMYPGSWKLRGWGSFGMNAATSIDVEDGCEESQEDKQSCDSFTEAAIVDKSDNPALVPLFTTTPAGPTEKNYRGYEFNPYNGLPRPDNVRESAPLVSDIDLVPDFYVLPPDLLKAVFARYNATGKKEGFAPVLFADGHSKAYSAKAIEFGKTGILWRFR